MSVENYFGRYAENKEEAIRFRDRYLLPELQNGLLHISPRDITGRILAASWPGTFVLVTIKLGAEEVPVRLQEMLAEFRE